MLVLVIDFFELTLSLLSYYKYLISEDMIEYVHF
jgi:hypothetical protein